MLRKIPLETLLSILEEIYNEGVDYVDLSKDNSDPSRDTLKIEVQPEYFTEEDNETFHEEDINELI
jgi:hypothetical protein